MTIKDFIGKEVISKATNRHFILSGIDGVEICAREMKANQYGTYGTYCWKTGTGPYSNAIAEGTLVFVDSSLTKPFIETYEKYLHTDGKFDQYLYYSLKYD